MIGTATAKVILVTLALSAGGHLDRLPDEPMATMAECLALKHQRDFQPPPRRALASFTYCEERIDA